jgi:16S rRNA (cytidine1402-2'-O)-methyltransferase
MKLLEELETICPQSQVVLARELTKRFEEILRGTPAELSKVFEQRSVKGEFVVLLSVGERGRTPAEPCAATEEGTVQRSSES